MSKKKEPPVSVVTANLNLVMLCCASNYIIKIWAATINLSDNNVFCAVLKSVQSKNPAKILHFLKI